MTDFSIKSVIDGARAAAEKVADTEKELSDAVTSRVSWGWVRVKENMQTVSGEIYAAYDSGTEGVRSLAGDRAADFYHGLGIFAHAHMTLGFGLTAGAGDTLGTAGARAVEIVTDPTGIRAAGKLGRLAYAGGRFAYDAIRNPGETAQATARAVEGIAAGSLLDGAVAAANIAGDAKDGNLWRFGEAVGAGYAAFGLPAAAPEMLLAAKGGANAAVALERGMSPLPAAERVGGAAEEIPSTELGPQIGGGVYKAVYAHGEDEVVAIVRRRRWDGGHRTLEERRGIILGQIELLNQLRMEGLPTVEARLVTVDREPAMAMKRYATSSKEMVFTGDNKYLNERSIEDLEKILKIIEEKKITLIDLQFLIDEDGSAVIFDPSDEFLHIPITHYDPDTFRFNENMIYELIRMARENIAHR